MVGDTLRPAVLLVSEGSIGVDLLAPVLPLLPNIRTEVCPDLAQVPALLAQNPFVLLVVHVPEELAPEKVKEFLWAVAHAERPVACLLLLEQWCDGAKAEYLRAGAVCCLPQTASAQRLANALGALTFQAGARAMLAEEAIVLDQDVADPDPTFYVLSAQMVQMMEQVRRVVPQDSTILFTGETGSGKNRLARVIHNMSPRRTEPFLIVDCNALSPSLIESELFGHCRGAFTGADRDRPGKFAAAGKGTLVLDEINSLPLPLQSKLLRVVEERVFEPVGSNASKPMRARLITISNAPLEQEVAAGRFRADLYYRLNVVGFSLPPLRDHVNAIGPLAQKFLSQLTQNNGLGKISIAREALTALERYHWPGNVRELRNVIERAATLFPGPEVELSHLPEALRANNDALQASITISNPRGCFADSLPSGPDSDPQDLTLVKTRERAEVVRITEALHKHRNNRLRAARELGISRMALYKKLHKYGLCDIA